MCTNDVVILKSSGVPRYTFTFRHPTASERPSFGDILASSLREREEILSVPEKDCNSHDQANLLGASLEAGLEMYKDIQNIYLKQSGARYRS